MTGRPQDHDRRRAALMTRTAYDGGCLLWTGHIQPTGYGQFHLDGRREYAHRASYRLFVGPIADGLEIDHLCRRRACVRPEHLEPVTPRENVIRAAKANWATGCVAGHAYTDATLYVRPDGRRACRVCQSERSRRYNARLAAAR